MKKECDNRNKQLQTIMRELATENETLHNRITKLEKVNKQMVETLNTILQIIDPESQRPREHR